MGYKIRIVTRHDFVRRTITSLTTGIYNNSGMRVVT